MIPVIKAYSDIYVEEASSNLGAMMEYAIRLGFNAESFWKRFVVSHLAREIEKGNPTYLVGHSGIEDILLLLDESPNKEIALEPKRISDSLEDPLSYDIHYWVGYVLFELQQKTGLSFFDIERKLPFANVLNMYATLHEADLSKFYDLAIKKITSIKEE